MADIYEADLSSLSVTGCVFARAHCLDRGTRLSGVAPMLRSPSTCTPSLRSQTNQLLRQDSHLQDTEQLSNRSERDIVREQVIVIILRWMSP